MELTPKQVLEYLKRPRVRVNCGQEFPLTVENSIPVARCGTYSDEENERQMNGLMRRWNALAQAQCDLNGTTCPSVTPVEVKPLQNSCEDNVWTVKYEIITKCEP